jgi:exonuclease VII large subunit
MDIERLSARLHRTGPATRIPELRAEVIGSKTRLIETANRRSSDSTKHEIETRNRLLEAERSRSQRRNDRYAHAADLLRALSPTETMARGYAFVEHRESGRPVRNVAGVSDGDQLRTRFLDGAIESTVTSVSSTTT